jgi:CDP-diacylglycerol pyrophosphatase
MRLLLGCVALLALGGAAQAADPDALWKIVSQKCVPNEREYGQPSPCATVDLDKGYVVLKDLVGDTQYLLIPTAKVTGIEDPAVLAPDAPNYFADAWAERHYTVTAAKHDLSRDDLSLAVNSIDGRTQNQLHIHIDCVAAAVRTAIAKNIAALEDRWASFPEPLAGHAYRAMRISGDALTINPFKQLAAEVVAPDGMGKQTLVVVGANLPGGTPGFVLLADAANLATGDRGAGEELQDHSCALAQQ